MEYLKYDIESFNFEREKVLSDGNDERIKNKITFKELNLNNIKDKDKITYRKVLQQTISLEKVS